MKRGTIWITAAAIVALIAALAPPEASAVKLDDTAIYIEINATDGDAGVHVFLDGEGWDTMQMIGPGRDVMFSVLAESSIGIQGITEFFFESAEPSFDEQPLEELLELFPEGNYRFKGTTTEGRRLNGKAKLTHNLPEAPPQISPIDGEAVDPEAAVFVWEPVADPPGSEIVGYQVVVGCEEPGSGLTADVGPDIDRVHVGAEVLEGQEECKWEVLAIEESGNQTISETEFEVE